MLLSLLQVGSLQMVAEFDPQFENFYKFFAAQLVQILPPGTNIQQAYEKGTDEQQVFVQNLALFLTGFFKVGTALWSCSRSCSCVSWCSQLYVDCYS